MAARCQARTTKLGSDAWTNRMPKFAIPATARPANAVVSRGDIGAPRRSMKTMATVGMKPATIVAGKHPQWIKIGGRWLSDDQSRAHICPTLPAQTPSGTSGASTSRRDEPGTTIANAATAAESPVANAAACSTMKRRSIGGFSPVCGHTE